MTYSTTAKTSIQTKKRDDLNSGTLRLVDGNGAALAQVTLDNPSGTVSTDVLTFSGFPKNGTASAGTVAGARFYTAGGTLYKTVNSVGIPGSGAQVIVDNGQGTLVLSSGQAVTIAASPTITHAA